jgi:mannose-6-phosphate isomerase-like protein (cupin superfamily)
MVAILDGGCRVVGLKEGEPERFGALRVWRHFGRESGAKAISLRVLELGGGEEATLGEEGVEEVLYVVGGRGRVAPASSRPRDAGWKPALPGAGVVAVAPASSRLSADDAIYLPPGTSFDLRAEETMTLVSSQCPELAPGAPRVVSLRDVPVQRTGDRWYRETITAEVTQFVGSIPPGRAPDHFHLYEEVICILEGEGVMWAGTSSAPVSAGSCIFLPIRQVHCLENRGSGELRLLGVFYPAGSPAVRYGV